MKTTTLFAALACAVMSIGTASAFEFKSWDAPDLAMAPTVAQPNATNVRAETIRYLQSGGYRFNSGEARLEPISVAMRSRDAVLAEFYEARAKGLTAQGEQPIIFASTSRAVM